MMDSEIILVSIPCPININMRTDERQTKPY